MRRVRGRHHALLSGAMNGRVAWIASGAVVFVFAALILAPRTSYQPGLLLAAHVQLSGECNTCHQPWHGPTSNGCISCHGGFDNNPHSAADVTDTDNGLIAGKTLVSSKDFMTCLSCHSEHQGRRVDFNVTATFACTFCHRHPAVDKVREHMTPVMKRKVFAPHLYKQPFNHDEHRRLMASATPPRTNGFACVSCHTVDAVAPGSPDRMSFKWSGCAGAGCHLVPQDKYMQMPASVGTSPQAIAYLTVLTVRHIEGVFTHSTGHLRSACEECHSGVAASKNPNDVDSLTIKRCFDCHTHQAGTPLHEASARPATHRVANARIAIFETRDAVATVTPEAAGSGEKRLVACADCHAFHSYGVLRATDFTGPAPKFLPNSRPCIALTLYVPTFAGKHINAIAGLSLRQVRLTPWWLGSVALILLMIAAVGYVRIIPGAAAAREAVAGVAPQRTPEVPIIDDTYQSSVRHLYIVGEAAGTASINLAMRSGRQVIEAVANELKRLRFPAEADAYEVAIIGCGPAGLGATATAKTMGLKYVTLEKMTPASTLRSYPRAKFVQATPIDIAEYGSFFLEGDDSRENLIKEWEKIIATLGLTVNEREEVTSIEREDGRFMVKTARGHAFRARCVVLAIGVRGNPRRLGIPGEEAGRVFYNLIEPGEFQNKKILVVGGGNAGTEIAQALSAPGLHNTVSYSFRSHVLTNVTPENAEKVAALAKVGTITIYPSSMLKQIKSGAVVLEPITRKSGTPEDELATLSGPIEIENDVVFAMIGAELPTGFLKSIGVRMGTKGRYPA
jgi:thioredoxin reductase (NADPH)